MAAHWKQLLARFDALSQRERALVAAAIVGAIVLIGNSLFIDLPLARARILTTQMTTEKGELQALQKQLAGLQREIRDPDEDNRQRLSVLRQQMQGMRSQLGQHERLLVSPQDIPGLLERLLARHATLRLVALRTLPTQPANAPELAVVEEVKAAVTPPADGKPVDVKPAPVARRDGLEVWKHGVEIRLQGSYSDLAAYLAELEGLPQKLVWGEVRLKADYPKSELHLKIYTYSLDQAWLRL